MQLESERQQEAERAAKVHGEMREVHSRLKIIEKELKSLNSNQVANSQTVCTLVVVMWRFTHSNNNNNNNI